MNILLVALGMMGQRYKSVLEEKFGKDLVLYTVDPKFPMNGEANHYTDIIEVPENISFDLAIDARPNKGRLGLLKHFLVRRIPRVIIEKPHASSIQESQDMLNLLQKVPQPPRIMVPFYRRFVDAFTIDTLRQLDAGPLRSVVVSSGPSGLGCVGVHYIDLANYLFDTVPERVYGQLEIASIPSPRGTEFMDDSGVIHALYPQGRHLLLNMLPHTSTGANISLIFEHGKIQYLDQKQLSWFWFRNENVDHNSPYARTHQEIEIAPPFPYELNLLQMMSRGIDALFSEQKVPTLYEGHDVLKILALATASSNSGCILNWEDSDAIDSIKFQFT